MVEYERCPHCKKALEIKVEIKDGTEFGESLISLTEHNIENIRRFAIGELF